MMILSQDIVGGDFLARMIYLLLWGDAIKTAAVA